MKISREGSTRFRGETVFVNSESEPVRTGSALKFVFLSERDPLDPLGNTHHDYTVLDSRKILMSMLDKLLFDEGDDL